MNFDIIDVEKLKDDLNNNMSSRDIAKKYNCSRGKILYIINHNDDLKISKKHEKITYKNENYFKNINTPVKAYLIGFLLGDSCLTTYNSLELDIAICDREILELFEIELGCRICDDFNINKWNRTFPNSRISIGNKTIVNDIYNLFQGRLKPERHIPNINENLENYLLAGFFDAEGCFTYGIRKNNRSYNKVSFTSHKNMLLGIQKILNKHNIVTKIKPKGTENCEIIEFANKKDVITFLNIIIETTKEVAGLKRKRDKIKKFL